MPKKRSNLQTKAEYYAVRFVLGAIGTLPLKISMRAGKTLGKAVVSLFPRLKKTGRRNLEIALPDLPAAEKEKILSGTFESLGRQLGFVSHFKEFSPEKVRDLVEVVGKENFDKARASGRGILFFTGHFGSWEIFNLLPPAFDQTMNILVRRIDNPLVENYVDDLRTRLGCVTLDKTTIGAKDVSRAGKRRASGHSGGFKRAGERRRFRGFFRRSGFDDRQHRQTGFEHERFCFARFRRLGRIETEIRRLSRTAGRIRKNVKSRKRRS